MLLKRKEKLPVPELLTLLGWLQSENMLSKKKFQFHHLLNECRKSTTNEVDVEGYFDDLMYDLFGIYDKIKNLDPKELEEKAFESPLFNILPKNIVEESKRGMESFCDLYEKMMMETKFDYDSIRNIQKTMFTALQTKFIMNEEYEKCIEIKQKLDEI